MKNWLIGKLSDFDKNGMMIEGLVKVMGIKNFCELDKDVLIMVVI